MNGLSQRLTIMNKTFREAINLAQSKAMESNEEVFIYGCDVGDHTASYGTGEGLKERFPNRVMSTPLSEDALLGIGIGAALGGQRPINIHIRSDFLILGMNQITNMLSNISYITNDQLKVPLTIRTVIGRGWGQGAQHSKSLYSFFTHLPGIKVYCPTSVQDAYDVTMHSIFDNHPTIIFEHRWLYDISGEMREKTLKEINIPGSEIVCEGSDITIVGISWMTIEAKNVADQLKPHGLNCEVIDLKSLSPLNLNPIKASIKKTGRLLVLENDFEACSVGSDLIYQLTRECFKDLKEPGTLMGLPMIPCPTARILEDQYYPNANKIADAIFKVLKKKRPSNFQLNNYSYENRFKGPF